ncbi:hypothetical protein [Streptomyces sp. NPDC048611]|uniref:hypothetical protein n=1 Tax=Streptomyces sp. NPDC048611 TaxID=3155635 RepID=UPI00343EBEDB
MCSQCGTRAEDWDQGGNDETEDAYVATTHRCIGCQVIADKQAEQPEGAEGRGVKVLLLPAAVHAATQLMAQLEQRQHHEDDD